MTVFLLILKWGINIGTNVLILNNLLIVTGLSLLLVFNPRDVGEVGGIST